MFSMNYNQFDPLNGWVWYQTDDLWFEWLVTPRHNLSKLIFKFPWKRNNTWKRRVKVISDKTNLFVLKFQKRLIGTISNPHIFLFDTKTLFFLFFTLFFFFPLFNFFLNFFIYWALNLLIILTPFTLFFTHFFLFTLFFIILFWSLSLTTPFNFILSFNFQIIFNKNSYGCTFLLPPRMFILASTCSQRAVFCWRKLLKRSNCFIIASMVIVRLLQEAGSSPLLI